MPAASVPDVLNSLTGTNPGRPLITAYDEATGARIELSAATYLNWVNKTANLLLDEYLLDEGDVVRLELPTHWLTPVFIGAIWAIGAAVTTSPSVDVQLIVRGPDDVPASGPALACSLDPFAGRFRHSLPVGVDDFGALWPGQPDVLTAPTRPGPATPAWRSPDLTQGDLLDATLPHVENGARLLTNRNPLDDQGISLLAALVGGSLILVSNPTDDGWTGRYDSELPTRTVAESRY